MPETDREPAGPAMPPEAAHNHKWKISDVVMFPALALAIGLELIWPTRIVAAPVWLMIAVGVLIVAAGFALIEWSKRALDAAQQPTHPGVPTTQLVTSGPFAWSRNPNYLGAILVALGLSIACNSWWFLAVTAIAATILDSWMIRPEERYLHALFGDEFDAYAAQVRRWI
ncbi:isoprenylcysteine carboxylmethyltransferase family protein [Alisedimentitalea sp. MJ-SS2]|uniref:methyltransferase family protein n=1 Tax=Aliisedimentitalea sp. MJ-SS2 TaxID=3049795 RepID=UPI00290619A4|nr:isoprenylcysteine carboxylmethyltransferase family protein [Alisedimentitalea sp. MJ-SS2]MDU8926009.1 isoprenylcysteine carboxylmethyltransferase family protein [Alisedimentitalea sp. MJ-SS2]